MIMIMIDNEFGRCTMRKYILVSHHATAGRTGGLTREKWYYILNELEL